jgi:hypothetical protein
MRRIVALLALLALPASADLRDYAGRYEQSDGNVVLVWRKGDALLVRPLFWRATQELVPDGEDRFHSRERPERKAAFERDEKGRVVSLTMNGIGHDGRMPRLTQDRPVPAQLLMNGRPRDAARAVLRRKDAPEVAVAWGSFLARALPSKWSDGAIFVREIARKHPRNRKLRKVEGALLVAAGKRAEAKKALEAAGDAQSLRMLQPDRSLDALFATPAPAEIAAVAQRWATRDLSPKDVEIVHRGTLDGAEVRVVSHRVHGSVHYGVVIVPGGAQGRPVVVEAKGVSPSYFPLDLSRAPVSMQMLGGDFIYFLPSYRGELLKFDGRTWTSEGDRTDVWDGATDDFLAFTAAALTVTPEADPARVGAFGRSRGGTVALLAAIRDRRYDCVVSWAAPADHFFEMMQSGWTPRERVAEGLRAKADVFGMGGQFIETFLAKPRSTAETRLHLIASSPLWFAERLPAAQAHYGIDDNIVSVRNGRALAARNAKVEMVWHEEAGHDLDQDNAWRETVRFLRQRLMPR